jgi:BA14K-like protein
MTLSEMRDGREQRRLQAEHDQLTQRKEQTMRRITSLAAIAALGIACVAADALAAERTGAARQRAEVNGAGLYRGEVNGAGLRRGEVNGGDYYRPGAGIAAGALVGGAVAASRPWNAYGGYGYGGYGYGGYGYGGYGYGGYDPGYTGYGPSYGGYGYDPGYQGYQGYDVGYAGYSASGAQDAAYCAQRFRSYDPASGTYLGYDGQRHPCP